MGRSTGTMLVVAAAVCSWLLLRSDQLAPVSESAAPSEPGTEGTSTAGRQRASDDVAATTEPPLDEEGAAWRQSLREDVRAYGEVCGYGSPIDLQCAGELCAIRPHTNEDRGLPYLRTLVRRPDQVVLRALAAAGMADPLEAPCMQAYWQLAQKSLAPAKAVEDRYVPPFCLVQSRVRSRPRYRGAEGELMAELCNELAASHGDADRVRYLPPEMRPAPANNGR